MVETISCRPGIVDAKVAGVIFAVRIKNAISRRVSRAEMRSHVERNSISPHCHSAVNAYNRQNVKSVTVGCCEIVQQGRITNNY